MLPRDLIVDEYERVKVIETEVLEKHMSLASDLFLGNGEEIISRPLEPWRRRLSVAGLPVNHITTAELLAAIADYAQRKERLRICTVNVDFVMKSRRSERLHEYITDCDISTADGKPVLWAAQFLGNPFPEKVSGSDLIFQICEMAAERRLSVYLLGALDPIAQEAADRLKKQFPGLRIAGAMSPNPTRYHDVEYNQEICDAIRRSKADILMVGFGCPKQEFWIEDYQFFTGAAVTIGVGASIDFAAGRFKRAPLWMQQAGLEWFYRLCQEPRRLWRRYLVDDPPFFWHVLVQKLAQINPPKMSNYLTDSLLESPASLHRRWR